MFMPKHVENDEGYRMGRFGFGFSPTSKGNVAEWTWTYLGMMLADSRELCRSGYPRAEGTVKAVNNGLKWKWKSLSHVWLFGTPWTKSSWNSPGQNTGVRSRSLLQGIFPTQGSNPGLPHCRRILYQLSHQGRPRILEWVVYPFSSGSSRPRNRTGVSCIAGGSFTAEPRGTP